MEWVKITGMRNGLVHDHVGINTELVWDTVANDIPGLKVKFEHILKMIDGIMIEKMAKRFLRPQAIPASEFVNNKKPNRRGISR